LSDWPREFLTPLDDAANLKELRVVASMQFGIDSLHTDTPIAEKTIPKLVSIAL